MDEHAGTSIVAEWRRSVASLWMICRFFVIVCLLSIGRALARGVDRRGRHAIEDFGYAAAPLVLFALIALLGD